MLKGRLPGSILFLLGAAFTLNGALYLRRTYILNGALLEVALGFLLAFMGYAWIKEGRQTRKGGK